MAEHVFAIEEPIVEGSRQLLRTDGRTMLFLMTETGPAVIDAVCPHAGAPLLDGRLSGDRIRCSRHGYMFNVRTGACPRAGREGFEELRVYESRLEGGALTVIT